MERITKTVFQKDLEKSVFHTIVLTVILGCLVFWAGIFFLTFSTNQINASHYLRYLKDVYLQLYDSCEAFVMEEDTVAVCGQAVKDPGAGRKLNHLLNQFNAEHSVKSSLILSDAQGNPVISTFNPSDLNAYMRSFNRAICENADQAKEKVYNTVYYLEGDYSQCVFSYPVRENGETVYFINLYLMGSDWSTLFPDYQYDGIITNSSGSVILCSRRSFLSERSYNKFIGRQGSYLWSVRGSQYLVNSEKLPGYDLTIYAMLYYPKNSSTLFIGPLIIVLIGSIWYGLARKMSVTMANKNASSIHELIGEIRRIRKGDYEHKVRVSSKDEYGEVANQINRMLDSLNELNRYNTELIQRNHLAEVKQLTAQINPHFMYNTLDTIRYLILTDPERAELLIEQFTQILRYSINNTKKDTLLCEDMDYIKDYLKIQKSRFSDRFHYEIHLEEECYGCKVPKLVMQPIIENSIKYGFKRQMELAIEITGYVEQEYLILKVADNGGGMEDQKVEELRRIIASPEIISEHNGLHNISRRLCLQYGEKSGLEIENRQGEGFTVTIRIRQEGEHV